MSDINKDLMPEVIEALKLAQEALDPLLGNLCDGCIPKANVDCVECEPRIALEKIKGVLEKLERGAEDERD